MWTGARRVFWEGSYCGAGVSGLSEVVSELLGSGARDAGTPLLMGSGLRMEFRGPRGLDRPRSELAKARPGARRHCAGGVRSVLHIPIFDTSRY